MTNSFVADVNLAIATTFSALFLVPGTDKDVKCGLRQKGRRPFFARTSLIIRD